MTPPDGVSALAASGPDPGQAAASGFLEDAPCGCLAMRRDGTVLGANRTLLRWARRTDGSVADLHLRDLLTPAGWVVYSMKCVPALAMQGRVPEVALDLRRASGPPMPVLASFQEIRGTAGQPDPTVRVMLFDATERRLYERELLAARRAAEEARARLSTVLESTTDGVLLVGPDWRIAYANPRAAGLRDSRAAGLHPGTLVGEDLRDAFPRDRDGAFLGAFGQAMAGEAGEGVEGLVGDAAWLWARAYPAPGGGMAVFFRDVTRERLLAEARQRDAERIEHLASHDTLTGLPNRRRFAERLCAALEGPDRPAAVMCLDLDRFKQVNDRLGHAAGDALLKAVADRLRTELRREDTVARFGGDEFAVLLAGAGRGGPGPTPAQAEEIAARIIRKLSAPYAIGVNRVEIGASVGLTLLAGPASDPDTLLAEADLALYEAKRAGRGRHAVFRPAMMSAHRSRLELSDALRLGLERGELLLHYQPLVRVEGRRICGHEALLRWDRPGHGLVPPGSFIPLAEETGLISPLGAFVLDRACRDAAAWPDATLRVAVNVSPLQFRDPGLVDTVADALARSGLPPARLELEVTEGLLLDRTEEVLATMRRLRGIGVGFAMDDFGTGFSSLSSLRAFPFERVKIDRSFLREAATRAEDAAIVETIATLCRRLGMTCLAEGVETEAQFALLARIGCAEAQGYFLGRPVPQATQRLVAG